MDRPLMWDGWDFGFLLETIKLGFRIVKQGRVGFYRAALHSKMLPF